MMLNCEEIKSKLIELCSEIFQNSGVDADLIEYVDFVDDLGMDSINFITLIVEIEDCFEILVPDDLLMIENFKNVDDVVKIVFTELTNEKEDNCDD